MDSAEAKALAVQVAQALRSHPIYGGRGGQKALGRLLEFTSGTISGALLHPEVKMSGEFIKRLAAGLPDEFGWAASRLQAIEFPEGTAPPSPEGAAARREVIDRIVTALEVAARELKQLARELE